jgi:hypothetical protein
MEIAEFAGLEGGHEARVHRQHAEFAIRSGEIDVVHGSREHFFLRSDDVELKGHDLGKC